MGAGWGDCGGSGGRSVQRVWRERYQRQVQRHDEQELHIQDGCLVLADGRLPALRDIADPVMLGVHQAALEDAVPGGTARSSAPVYIPRDAQAEGPVVKPAPPLLLFTDF